MAVVVALEIAGVGEQHVLASTGQAEKCLFEAWSLQQTSSLANEIQSQDWMGDKDM